MSSESSSFRVLVAYCTNLTIKKSLGNNAIAGGAIWLADNNDVTILQTTLSCESVNEPLIVDLR